MQQLDDGPHRLLQEDQDIELMYVEPSGFPVYYCVDNLDAARSISTDDVWPEGVAELNLSGAGIGFLGMWDSGAVLTGHQEFGGRITVIDGGMVSSHATNVAGVLVSAGVDEDARGMAFEADLQAWDWQDDFLEMLDAASEGMRVSNHSYGWTTGWRYSGGEEPWYWFGEPEVSETEDYRFGFYSSAAMDLDLITQYYPQYLMVRSAGNDRIDTGPEEGIEHFVQQDGDWILSTTVRQSDGGTSGYDCLGSKKTAKNILTVGAVVDLPDGYAGPQSVVMTDFSNWGPTDDGRIKPDIVANGTSLYTTDIDHAADYSSKSGTSMACPNAAGSIAMLGQHYQNLLGEVPLAATMKGLVIHTADEAGPHEGPDYMFGWGLMNTRAAAELISLQVYEDWHIIEGELPDQGRDEYALVIDAGDEVCITMCWTDVAGTPPVETVDPPDPILVHDLDLVLMSPTEVAHLPWILDPAFPSFTATRGDNTRDNVEQIRLSATETGLYGLSVIHKGVIDPQSYSLFISGATLTECLDPKPVAPEVAIVYTMVSVELSWPPVTETVEGCPIVVEYYEVWKSSDYLAPFSLLDVVTATEYLDWTGSGGTTGFYRVVAVGPDS